MKKLVVYDSVEKAEKEISHCDELAVFSSMEVADSYANGPHGVDAHQRNRPVVLTPGLMRALKAGRIVCIGVNGWEYAVMLKAGK